MINYFKPYDGEKPYIFVSYAHKNSERVLEIINDLRNKHYLLWYDEGIPAGSDWPQNIADHMSACDSVLMFLSKEFYDSPNCAMEVSEAQKQHKRIYQFNLEDDIKNFPELSDELLGCEEDYQKERKVKRKFNWWIVGFCVAIVAVIVALFSIKKITGGKTLNELRAQQEKTVDVIITDEVDTSSLGNILTKNVDFKDQVTKNYVKNKLEVGDEAIPVSRLLELTDFMVCGSLVVEDPSQLGFSSNGDALLNNWVVIRGPIKDLSVQSYMLNLKRLVLGSQEIEDISALSSLTQLEYLDLSGNEISDIYVLETMKNLRELHIEHTKVESLDVLKDLPNLEYIYISADMLPMENNTKALVSVVW